MKPTVYIETSIFGYLAMRGSSLLQVAANQQMTRDWWDNYRGRYEVFVSRFVVNECSAGDPVAAKERLVFLAGIPLLQVSDAVNKLSKALLDGVPLPEKASVHALHISIAATNSIEYLLTWNCTHIANPALRKRIERVCLEEGYDPPVVCTPLELMEIYDEF